MPASTATEATMTPPSRKCCKCGELTAVIPVESGHECARCYGILTEEIRAERPDVAEIRDAYKEGGMPAALHVTAGQALDHMRNRLEFIKKLTFTPAGRTPDATDTATVDAMREYKRRGERARVLKSARGKFSTPVVIDGFRIVGHQLHIGEPDRRDSFDQEMAKLGLGKLCKRIKRKHMR